MKGKSGQINLTLIWAAIVLLVVIYYWSTKWWLQVSPTALLLTGSDVIRMDPRQPKAVQPIAFPHQTHTQNLGLDCAHCHIGVRTEVFAGLPSVDICMGCHSAKVG
jgi:hypothetical protein